MADGERLAEIVEAAVARGDAPGVVAAVATGDTTQIATAGVMAIGVRRCGPAPCSGSPTWSRSAGCCCAGAIRC